MGFCATCARATTEAPVPYGRWDCNGCPSWPGLSRPSTSSRSEESKTWMPAFAGMTVNVALNPLRLQPAFEQRDLPQLGMLLRRQLAFRIGEEAVDVLAAKQLALACGGRIKDVAHEIEERPAQILERGHRKIALRPVDHLGRRHLARGLLEDPFAAVAHLELGRDAGRELDQVVVEERHARLQAPRHGHVVDALDGVVDQHDLRIE